AHLGFKQDLRLELAFGGRHHANARVAVHIHETQGAEAVEPGVGHALDDRILATALRNDFFQFLHGLRAFAPGRAVGRQHQGQFGTDLLAQDAAGELGEFLEFAGVHQSAFLPGSLPERFSSFFSSDFTRLSSFLMSSSAGRCSGWMPRWPSMPRTLRLFCTCSSVMRVSPCRFACCTLWLVISVARFLAAMVSVGRKSASGRAGATPRRSFIFWVLLPPNRAVSPLERMRPKPASSTPRS